MKCDWPHCLSIDVVFRRLFLRNYLFGYLNFIFDDQKIDEPILFEMQSEDFILVKMCLSRIFESLKRLNQRCELKKVEQMSIKICKH